LHEQGYPKLVKEIKTMLSHLKEMNEEAGGTTQAKEK
jgi:hypothetical protein